MRSWQKYVYFKLLKLDKLFASLGWYPPYPMYEGNGNPDRPHYTEGPVEWNRKLEQMQKSIQDEAAQVYPRSLPVDGWKEVDFMNAIHPRQIIGLPAYPGFRATCNSILQGKMRMVSTGESVRMVLPDYGTPVANIKFRTGPQRTSQGAQR